MPKAAVQTTLRVAQDLYERVAKLAKSAGMSINEWAAAALREKADRDERGG